MEHEETRTVIDADFITSRPPTFIHRVDLLEKYEKLLVDPTNILFVGVTGSGKTMCVKSNIEHRLIRNPDMIALILDYKNESAFWEKQNDLKMIEELEKWGEKPAAIKTMLVIPFLATKMTEEVLKDGWHYDNRVYVKYVTLNQRDLDYKDYSLLSRINVGKMETVAVNFIEEFIEILKIKGRPVNAETLLEIAYQKMKSPRDRLRIKRELKKISTIGFIGQEGSEHNFNLYKLLKFAIENDIRVIQFAMGDLSEDLQPVRSVFARKIIEEALSIKRGNRITNRLMLATMELQEYTKRFGSGFCRLKNS